MPLELLGLGVCSLTGAVNFVMYKMGSIVCSFQSRALLDVMKMCASILNSAMLSVHNFVLWGMEITDRTSPAT